MESEEDISDRDTQTLDYRFRSLTCLGEVLYNEDVHDPIPAQGPGHQTESRHALQETGGKLVLQISRVLVRQPGENVAFAVMMSNGGVEKTMVTTNTPSTLLNPMNNASSLHGNPNSDEVSKLSRAYTNSPSPGSGNPPSEGLELRDHPSDDDIIRYIVKHFQPMGVRQTSDNKEDFVTFDAHVRNTLKLLVSCSNRDHSATMRADTAFLIYTACMGIGKWSSRYTVDPIVRNRYSYSDIPFESFLQLEDLLPWVAPSLKDWPTARITDEEKKTLSKFLPDFAKIFDWQYDYTEYFGDNGAAAVHREDRRKIAHDYLEAAMKAVGTGHVDGNVARFYHVTLGQALKDAQDWAAKAMTILTSRTSPTDDISEILLSYVMATVHLSSGIFNSGVLLTQYKTALQKRLKRGAPKVPMSLWLPASSPSTLVTRHDSFDDVKYEGNRVPDDAETADDEGSNNDDDHDDKSMTAQTSSEPESWTTAFINWLRNTAKTHRAVNQLTAFAKSKSHRRIVRAIAANIEIHLYPPPSNEMEDWEKTIRDLFPNKTEQVTKGKAEQLIRELDYLAKHRPQKKWLRNQSSKLSFCSLNSRWSSSFDGTRHGESQFAIAYSGKVIAATRQSQKRAN